jgi:hypothetical protein
MIERIKDLIGDMERPRVMLSFSGLLTPDLVTALLQAVELRFDRLEADHKVRKRVFNVVMECLQNLYHHTTTAAGHAHHAVADPQGVVIVARIESGYSVLTGNYMAGDAVQRLRDHLDHINSLDPNGLRDLYKQRLAQGELSPKGGGGLGMIEIARKSGGKLEYGFVPHDHHSAFFSLNVNVNT